MSPTRSAGSLASWLCLTALLPFAHAADPPAHGPLPLTPAQRMTTERLRDAHESAAHHQANRQECPPLPHGLIDFRAILHAHAEDSSHTGGTREEMLADAKAAGVSVILLSDHYRPPRDFITQSWRGVRDGVLFLPGSEARGFLIAPTRSIMDRMELPIPEFLQAVRADGGLAFLSHVEERPNHPMDNLDGLEIYNRHYDAKLDLSGLLALAFRLTEPDSLATLESDLRLYPDALFAAQVTRQTVYLDTWDRETQSRRLTGIAANDCHHNTVLLVKMVDAETVRVGTNVESDDEMRLVKASIRPGIREMTRNHKPGDILARVDLDPYSRSFRNVSTHILATELTEPAIRDSLREGRAYVSHDWMCDPTGFRFELIQANNQSRFMGQEVAFAQGARLVARFPASCQARLLRNGQLVAEQVSDQLDHEVTTPGVYRVEGWLDLGGESRPWIYSNPIYIRER